MPYPVKGLLEVYEDMIEILLMLQVFLAEDPEIDYLFCGAPSGSKPACCSVMDRVKRIWYLSPLRAEKVQASLRIRAVSPEPSLLAHTSSESRGTFRQKARFLVPLNSWACAVEICHDGMLEDTNSLDGALMISSAFGCNLFRITFNMTLLGWLIRLMVL